MILHVEMGYGVYTSGSSFVVQVPNMSATRIIKLLKLRVNRSPNGMLYKLKLPHEVSRMQVACPSFRGDGPFNIFSMHWSIFHLHPFWQENISLIILANSLCSSLSFFARASLTITWVLYSSIHLDLFYEHYSLSKEKDSKKYQQLCLLPTKLYYQMFLWLFSGDVLYYYCQLSCDFWVFRCRCSVKKL